MACVGKEKFLNLQMDAILEKCVHNDFLLLNKT